LTAQLWISKLLKALSIAPTSIGSTCRFWYIISLTQTFSDPPLNSHDPETKLKRDVKQVAYAGKLEEKALFNATL
jgi:hypothetical protein